MSMQIARMLLTFGADPNATDKSGRKAREVSSGNHWYVEGLT